MKPGALADLAAWFSRREKVFRWLAIGLAAAVFIAQWIRAGVRLEDGDFFLHWKFASRFVGQQLMYADGLHVPYPPFWGLAWSPIAAFSLSVAKVLAYPLSLAALGLLWFVLDRLSRRRLPLDRTQAFWAGAAALALTSRFVIRELPECGPNLLLLALSWLAVWLWVERRDVLGGACLGLAIAMKCTPGLFLAYFAWKRQWKMTASAAVAALVFTLAPAVWQGPAAYRQHMEIWLTQLARGAAQSDPSRGVLGEEELKNLSLRPAAARFLMRLPAGHVSRIDHPAYLEFLDLSPAAADRIVKLALLALVVFSAWKFRRPAEARDDLTIVWECAAVSVLILLLSPITWAQHCVAFLPAFYLLARAAFVRGRSPRWIEAAVAAFVVANLLLSRGLIGRDWAMLLASYHLQTFSFLAVLAVLFACRARESALTASADAEVIRLFRASAVFRRKAA